MAYRGISDTVGHSESLAALSDTAERLYWRLLAHSDPHGRVPGSPAKTRALCFPLLKWTHEQVGWAMSELEAVGRVQLYDVDGQVCIQVTDFDANQPPEFIRRRGKPRIPESPTLKSRTHTEYSGVLYKLPANDNDSRTTPDQVGTTPAPRQVRQRKQVLNPTAAGPARDDEDDAAALDALLERIGVNGSLRVAAHQDVTRALACAEVAATDADHNPAGYFRRLLESGDWPTAAEKPGDVKPRDPAVAIAALIRNGVVRDLVDLDAELAAYPELSLEQRDALRSQVEVAA